jgi:hypothetical protein
MRSVRLALACALLCAGPLSGCGGAPSSAHSADADPQALADAQVALVLLAANKGEVTTADAAEPNLRLPAIDAYARLAIADHTAAMAREELLVAAEHITPQRSAVSDALMERTLTETLYWVLQAPGLAYDLSYICTELVDDAATVEALNRLAVTVENRALRAETLRAGDTIAQHMALAEHAISAQGGCFGGGS